MLPPPLLRLPIELHRDIIDRLELQDRARLSLTSRYFSTIKPLTHEDFLAAETKDWAAERDLYSCKGCVRFQHLLRFSDDMRKGKRARHRISANTRFCVTCGVDRRWYAPETEITIMGQPYVLCKLCNSFPGLDCSKGPCSSCSSCAMAIQKRSAQPYSGAHQDDSEDDWAYSTKSCAGGKHSEEVYGLWPDDV